jgi:hypothetical protein
MAAAVSRRKHLFSSAACSGVSGGTNRVFTRPACGALVMTANAQSPFASGSATFGSRTRNGFIRQQEKFFTLQEDDLNFPFTKLLLLKSVNNTDRFRRLPS